MIFSSLIQPYFDYCSVVWDGCGTTLAGKIQKLQNRAARVLTSANYDTSTDILFEKLRWTHGSGTFASRIDMIWAPLNMADLVQECEYHPSFLTDHQYLLVKCSFRQRLVMGPGVWKFNTSLLSDLSYISLITSLWSFWQTYADHSDFEADTNLFENQSCRTAQS